MNRLQKKCFIAATGMHLLLVVILLVGPAFLAAHSKKADDLPILDFIPAKLIDAPFSGGGTPNATPPPPAPTPVVVPPAPVPEPVKTLVQKIEQVFKPEPVKPAPVEPDKADPDDLVLKKVTKPAPTKPKNDISLTKVTRTAKSVSKTSKTAVDTSEADERAAVAAANAARKSAIGRSLRNLNSNLSTGTTVDIPGPGGAAYANYAQVVKSVYTQAWIVPTDADDDSANTRVKVTIARDGTVIEAHVVNSSGSAPVDRSVEQTLRRVSFVAPFPDGAKENQRSFIINFNLKAKRLLQ